MTVLVALVAGFVLGTTSKGEDWEEVRRLLVALCGSDEFADVVTATRAQVANSLRVLAQMIDGPEAPSGITDGDVMDRVRHLIAHD